MSVAHRSSPTARRSLLTATAAGTLLGVLWFVPSANASGNEPTGTPAAPTTQVTQQARAVSPQVDGTGEDVLLADTGSVDTTPYVVGGTLFLVLGAGFIAYAVRRERIEF